MRSYISFSDKYLEFICFLSLALYVRNKILTSSWMKESAKWLSEKEASEALRVDVQILEFFREEGYLKPGSHWRSSSDPEQFPWKPKAFYLISQCKEVVDSWKDNGDASFSKEYFKDKLIRSDW